MSKGKVPFVVGRTTIGFGLFATKLIPLDKCIIEYTGPIITNEEAAKRRGKYLFKLDERRTVGGSPRTNIARYITTPAGPTLEASQLLIESGYSHCELLKREKRSRSTTVENTWKLISSDVTAETVAFDGNHLCREFSIVTVLCNYSGTRAHILTRSYLKNSRAKFPAWHDAKN
jgi:hypothetical protein